MSQLDVIIIADYGVDSVSGSNPMKLTVGGRIADIQTLRHYSQGNGVLAATIPDDDKFSWSSAYRFNGVKLLDRLLKEGYQVALVNDFSKEKDQFRALLKHNPKLIVVSTTFILDKPTLQRFYRELRELSGAIPLLVGGPFVYTSYLIRQNGMQVEYRAPEITSQYLFQASDDPEFDLVIVSPAGEESIIEAVECARAGKSFETVKNRAQVVNHEVTIVNKIAVSRPELETIDWASLPDAIFSSGVVSLQGSVGCPFKCAFCNFVKDAQQQKAKAISDIIVEMKAIKKRGGEFVWFVDDIFRLGQGNLDQFSRALISAGIDLKWMTFIRADTVKGVDFHLLHEAGCIELQLGLESAAPEVLQAMNKKADPLVYQDVIERAMRAGINISAYFIFGHPGETEESINATVEFINTAQHPELPGAFSWSFFPYLLVPLSPLFTADMRKEFDLDGYMYRWSHRTMDDRQALGYIKKTFMDLDETGPIYRSDNQVLLAQLSDPGRKQFFKLRHQFAKRQQAGALQENELIEQFEQLFRP